MATIPAYSIVLWDLLPGYPIPGPQNSPPVPAGMVWVVREAAAVNVAGGGQNLGIASIILEVNSQPIWRTPFNGTATWRVYDLRDSRYVMAAGDALGINTDDPNWSLRVSGYQLTA